MTYKQRIEAMYKRAGELRRRTERRRMILSGSASVALFVAILFLVSPSGVLMHAGGAGLYSGAFLLSSENGGYILTAVLAFMAGVAVTAGIRQWRRKQKERERRRE